MPIFYQKRSHLIETDKIQGIFDDTINCKTQSKDSCKSVIIYVLKPLFFRTPVNIPWRIVQPCTLKIRPCICTRCIMRTVNKASCVRHLTGAKITHQILHESRRCSVLKGAWNKRDCSSPGLLRAVSCIPRTHCSLSLSLSSWNGTILISTNLGYLN